MLNQFSGQAQGAFFELAKRWARSKIECANDNFIAERILLTLPKAVKLEAIG